MASIKMPHKVCGINCMWNGIEDQYEWVTGTRIPNHLFFSISGIGNFVYLKNKTLPAPKTVYWSNGLTKTMYEFLPEIVGYTFIMKEGLSFKEALKQVKKHLDCGIPVIIGATDMYHLPYFKKFYHKIHIPIHYIMATGYDNDHETIAVLDCDRETVQQVSYQDLEQAWNVHIPGYSKKNTFFVFQFDEVKQLEPLIYTGLKKKSEFNLNPPASIFGIKGIRKLGQEFLSWQKELNDEQYRKCLLNLIEYSGFPPMLPETLLSERAESNETSIHRGGRNVLSNVLEHLSELYNEPNWRKSAELFRESGAVIEEITRITTDFLLDRQELPNDIENQFFTVADKEELAYKLIFDAAR